MIAKNYASNILNTLFGVGSSSLSLPSKVYIGLCAREPYNKDGSGSVTNAGEPIEVKSYDRVEVSGKDAARRFFSAAVSGEGAGVITNNDDIQFKSARQNYPETINYWFLSTGNLSRNADGVVTSQPAAFLWGKIKDVLFEKTEVALSHFAGGNNGGASDIHRATVESDLPLDLVEGTKYIVYWRGKEYEETAAMYEDSASGTTYTVLGNPYIIGGEDNGKSFGVLYHERNADGSIVYELTAGEVNLESVDSGEVAVYSINGIEVRRATVPTFYKGELQASIDV